MANKLRKLLYELGKNVPPATRANEIIDLTKDRYWNHNRLAKLRREIQLEKVTLQAYRNASLLNQQQETKALRHLMDALQEEYEKRCAFSERVMPRVRVEVVHILEQADVNFLFIKGSSLEAYPHGYLRQMNDLDLIVETWDDLFLAARALEAQGYQHAETLHSPWVMRISSSGKPETQMVGRLFLARHEGDHLIELDLHLAPFAIASTGVLVCDMWERAQAQRSTIPTPEDKLLVLLAHAANHGYFLIKDFNDVYTVLEWHKETFDWDYFCRCVQKSTLSYAAHHVLKHVRQEYAKECVPEQVLDTLQQSKETTCAVAIAVTSKTSKEKPRRRWIERLMHTLHTLAFERANHGLASGLRKVMEFLGWSFRLSILQGRAGDHSIVQRLLHSTKSQLFPSPRRGQQLAIVSAAEICGDFSQEQRAKCLQIPPDAFREAMDSGKEKSLLEVKPVGRTTLFLRLGSAEAVLTPIDLFIPTQDAVFTGPEVADLEKLVKVLVDARA
jgi:hypothetical protein